jgi:hypothetical protein
MSEMPVSRPATEIAIEADEQGIVILHCTVPGPSGVRIWRSTFLFDHASGHRSKLLHAENICMYPEWYYFDGNHHTFTLYFEALPKDCSLFDMVEVIPQPGGFVVNRIPRNPEDVYRVSVS